MAMEVPGKEREEDQSGGGWIMLRTTCLSENHHGRKRETELNAGVS